MLTFFAQPNNSIVNNHIKSEKSQLQPTSELLSLFRMNTLLHSHYLILIIFKNVMYYQLYYKHIKEFKSHLTKMCQQNYFESIYT